VLPVFSCPSLRDPTVMNGQQFLFDYAGNAGLLTTQILAMPPPNGAIVPNTNPLPIRPGTMPRGFSNTLVVGEKYVWMGLGTPEAMADDVSGYYAFSVLSGSQPGYSNVRFGDAGPYQDSFNPSSSFSAVRLNFPFGSAHPAAMNALFGDGSVRTIRYNNPVMPTICNRLNTTPVNTDDL
jgi:prepilin-type processing-associated H-X9-DG protein